MVVLTGVQDDLRAMGDAGGTVQRGKKGGGNTGIHG